jgi:hypothetical protein
MLERFFAYLPNRLRGFARSFVLLPRGRNVQIGPNKTHTIRSRNTNSILAVKLLSDSDRKPSSLGLTNGVLLLERPSFLIGQIFALAYLDAVIAMRCVLDCEVLDCHVISLLTA